MTILRKILHCQSFKNSHEKVEFISVKLQAYSVQIAHYIRKLFQKLVFLKGHFSKSLWCSIVLIGCGPAVHIPHFYQNQSYCKTWMKILPWWKLVFSKNASLEFIPFNFIKNELYHRDYLAWALQGTFFSILENFLRGIIVFLLYRRL